MNTGVAEPRGHRLAGILLLSLATLLLELALTRVLSVALWYHFGFLVISTALLGFGASGVVLSISGRLRQIEQIDPIVSICALAFGVTVLASYWMMQKISFNPFSLATDHWQLGFMVLYFGLLSLPFFCAGLAISVLLARSGPAANRFYAYDLVGAGLGCALIVAVIPFFGGSGSVLFAGFVATLAAICFALRGARKLLVTGTTAAAILLLISIKADVLIPVHVSANKQPFIPKPLYSAWNTMSLVEVHEIRSQNGGRAQRRLVIDAGTASTGMVDLRPNVQSALEQVAEGSKRSRNLSRGGMSTIAYALKSKPKLLIIGSGAGDQILDGITRQASSITAVEINPIVNDIVARRMNDFWGDLFHQPSVHLVTEEGRSFVRRSQDRYDSVISVHTISNAAISSGALSLAENYVLTEEAFADYLDHLTPDGTIFFTRPEFQIPRLFSTARVVFDRKKLGSIEDNVFAFRVGQGQMVENRQSFSAGFLLKKSPFNAEELREIRRLLGPQTETLYAPDEKSAANIYRRIVSEPDLRALYTSTPVQLEPATDDKPFFNQHTRWSAIGPGTVTEMFSQKKPLEARLSLEDRPVAEVTLLILLVQSIIVSAVLILLPLALSKQVRLEGARRANWLIYFAALGAGFILIEIALLQRFMLFLGQPIYTYSVVLAALLVFTGIGSQASGRWSEAPERVMRKVFGAVLLVIALTALVTPLVFWAALGLSLAARIVIALILVAPLGFVLGMPFPLGLTIAGRVSSAMVAWAWAVNGFCTVIGTVIALILGMMIGFRMVLLLALLCYTAALVSVWSTGRAQTKNEAAMQAAS